MPRKSRPKKPTVAQLLKQSALLSDAELRSLILGLEAMECDLGKPVERDRYGKPVDLQGHIDEKWINGCGPYRYLRWWDDGKHRSVYLGKGKGE
ncbi:MAG: hypothetical protein ACFCU8_05605 [Thermosynechococcaceae cyanobacterium]